MRKRLFILVFMFVTILQPVLGQTAEEIIQKITARLDKINDYEAKGKMKTNVVFIKAPIASVKIYFKKPNKLRINNEKGISFIPKGSVNINLNTILQSNGDVDVLDMGVESGSGLRVIKLLPRDENADIVLSTLYIDEKQLLVKNQKQPRRKMVLMNWK